MDRSKFNLLEEFEDDEIDTIYEDLRKVWYFINERFGTEIRVQDDDYFAFSEFCYKVSVEYGKRHDL